MSSVLRSCSIKSITTKTLGTGGTNLRLYRACVCGDEESKYILNHVVITIELRRGKLRHALGQCITNNDFPDSHHIFVSTGHE